MAKQGRNVRSLCLIVWISLSLVCCCTGITPRRKFDELDKDHNGYLSLSEYMAGQQFEPRTTHTTTTSKEEDGDTTAAADIPIGGSKKDKLSFSTAFTSSTAMIIATEIGDKTFFIAAVMSMTKDRIAVFLGAILALFCMTVLRYVH